MCQVSRVTIYLSYKVSSFEWLVFSAEAYKEKSCIQETMNLWTCADSSTDTINSVVMCPVSRVTWYVSHVTCCVSHVACHMLHINAANIHSHVLEFLKVTVMNAWLHKMSENLCKIWTNEKETGNSCPEFLVTVWQSLMFLWHFYACLCAKKLIRQFWLRHKMTFRMSDWILHTP